MDGRQQRRQPFADPLIGIRFRCLIAARWWEPRYRRMRPKI
jgi:hypothetical protein